MGLGGWGVVGWVLCYGNTDGEYSCQMAFSCKMLCMII